MWIGTDVGLHNYGLFLIMLALLCLHFGMQIITSLIGLISAAICLSKQPSTSSALNWNSAPSTALSIVNIVLCVILIGANGFAIKQTLELVQYHYTLLKTGTLTKEDSGSQNIEVSAAFNRFNFKDNLVEAFNGLFHEKRILA